MSNLLDANETLQYGLLISAAYSLAAAEFSGEIGAQIPSRFDLFQRHYTIIAAIYGNDLIPDLKIATSSVVSFGFVIQDKVGNVVVAFRGTEGLLEWLHDFAIWQRPCPFLAGAGFVENGFANIYESLSVTPNLVNKLAKSILTLNFPYPIASLVICGHSLGGALACLLGLDLIANYGLAPSVYTFGSPRVGDSVFAKVYTTHVRKSFRIANQLDIVSQLPLQHSFARFLPQYDHVGILVNLDPFMQAQKVLPPRCEHLLSTYLFLLTSLPGLVLPQAALPILDPACSLEFPPWLL